ncbi:MAG: GNAT family N-acetyltransferase [Acidimicrobiales bacterium]|nr:GNAT family N-acetyltransferase [Acidimicrobiales bacterium]
MSLSRKVAIRGADLEVRDIRPDDAERLVAFHASLSAETKYRRFFMPHPVLPPDEVARFTCVDGEDRVALVVVDDDAIIAVARYDRSATRPDEAEVAFVVTDGWQGEGLGTLLLESLVEVARQHAIGRFTADTLSSNIQMMKVFRHSRFTMTTGHDHGVAHVEFAITPETGADAGSDVAEVARGVS